MIARTEHIDAKKTIYRGIEFRSRMEAGFAVLFDHLRWKWRYEPHTYAVQDFSYTPDFFVADEMCEVDLGDPECIFWQPDLEDDDGCFNHVFALECKPSTFDLKHAKEIVNWSARLKCGTQDSQILNSWQMAADGADLWYAIGDAFENPRISEPTFVRAGDFESKPFPLWEMLGDSDEWMARRDLALKFARYYRFGGVTRPISLD